MLHTQEMLMLLLRACAVLVALVLFYMALFMYADEAGAWQNRLVDLWVEISSGNLGLLTTQASLVKESSRLVSSGLTWLLGERLVSVQMVAVSFALSVASAMFLVTLIRLISWLWLGGELTLYVLFGLVLSMAFFLFGLFGVKGLCERDRPLMALAIPMALTVTAVSFSAHLTSGPEDEGLVSAVVIGSIALAASMLGVLCDLLLLVVNLLILQSMATTGKTVILLFGFIYNLAWVVFLACSVAYDLYSVLPYWWGWVGWLADPIFALMRWSIFGLSKDMLEVIIEIAFMTSLFTLCTSFGLLAIILAALAHRLFWPVAERSIYALYQWKVFTDKRLQISTGVALLIFAFPGLHSIFAMFRF